MTNEPNWDKISEIVKAHDFKILEIQDTRHDNISVSVDYDVEPSVDRFVCILYTPNMEKKNKHDFVEHYHIHLQDDSAVRLHNWLGEYLKEKGLV